MCTSNRPAQLPDLHPPLGPLQDTGLVVNCALGNPSRAVESFLSRMQSSQVAVYLRRARAIDGHGTRLYQLLATFDCTLCHLATAKRRTVVTLVVYVGVDLAPAG